jgi:hypothetical protein
MCFKKIFAVIAATAITGTFLLSLGEAASGPPRWVSQAAAGQITEPSEYITGEQA